MSCVCQNEQERKKLLEEVNTSFAFHRKKSKLLNCEIHKPKWSHFVIYFLFKKYKNKNNIRM